MIIVMSYGEYRYRNRSLRYDLVHNNRELILSKKGTKKERKKELYIYSYGHTHTKIQYRGNKG